MWWAIENHINLSSLKSLMNRSKWRRTPRSSSWTNSLLWHGMLVASEMWEPSLGSSMLRLYFPHPVSHLTRPASHVVRRCLVLRHASASSFDILPHVATSFSLLRPGCRIRVIMDGDDGVEKGEVVSRGRERPRC